MFVRAIANTFILLLSSRWRKLRMYYCAITSCTYSSWISHLDCSSKPKCTRHLIVLGFLVDLVRLVEGFRINDLEGVGEGDCQYFHPFAELKVKEIKNGRLAMFSMCRILCSSYCHWERPSEESFGLLTIFGSMLPIRARIMNGRECTIV